VILRFGSIVILWLVIIGASHAAPSTAMPRQSDISSTLHNLSATGSATRKVTSSESQICVFCHTPHGANTAITPLWNRDLSIATYSTYDSSSIQADIGPPGDSSKLCLSCHDGTIAIGSLNVLNGVAAPVTMVGTSSTGDGSMPDGSGALTGFTRNLGKDLSGDHPISFSFAESQVDKVVSTVRLAAADGELRDPPLFDQNGSLIVGDAAAAHIAKGSKIAPLDADGKVQCTTCHDPHVSGTDDPNASGLTENNVKFLRARRFQMEAPTPDSGTSVATFTLDKDIVCLECHAKPGWAASVHAVPGVASTVYKTTAAELREFPLGIKVWQAACLNCHDTHTVQGANRLLREGTDSTATPKSGGKPALEETCFQCHTSAANSILENGIANIEKEFSDPNFRMPLNVYNGDKEVHDIQNADFTEGDVPAAGANDPNNASLGWGANITTNLANRHAECTDCHNPHRMTKTTLAGGTDTSKGTHPHTTAELGVASHSNLISGVLAGTWGVEPVYNAATSGGAKFGVPSGRPIGFKVLSGVGNVEGVNVTKEYQICLKCHSNYGYDDKGTPDNAQAALLTNVPNDRPETGSAVGLTSFVDITAVPTSPDYIRDKAQTNSFKNYTNQAMEFQAPSLHKGLNVDKGSEAGAGANYNINNNRSWHPVMEPTGRPTSNHDEANSGLRQNSGWRAPFNNIGVQTMYCTDCHGANTGGTTVTPATGVPWGPHGSSNAFILKGSWDRGSNKASSNNLLCFKCHQSGPYSGSSGGPSAFFIPGNKEYGHTDRHGDKVSSILDCMWCHVAVPHGWKNRSLLVNLNDIGPEVMCREIDKLAIDRGGYGITCTVGMPMPVGTIVPNSAIGGTIGYDNPPYYVNARLKISSFPNSGRWSESNCEGKSGMQSTCNEGASY